MDAAGCPGRASGTVTTRHEARPVPGRNAEDPLPDLLFTVSIGLVSDQSRRGTSQAMPSRSASSAELRR